MRRQWTWWAVTGILLLAATMRLLALGQVPPGLAHDEVNNWLIAKDILRGNHAIYFTAAYGHEPLYQYVQAATVHLFGDNWLGLRWPSFAFALLGMAATYSLIRRLFDSRTALLTLLGLAVNFWSLFYARVAYRAISLPFTAALAAYFLLRREEGEASYEKPPSDWLLAGLFLGLSLYTYMAARILPFILAAVVLYARLVRPRESVSWTHALLVLSIAALTALPLVLWLAAHPGAEYRIAEVREPFDRLLVGDPSLVWQNLIANLRFFTFAGDPLARYTIPGRPVFATPVMAALFLMGVLIAVWRWREPRYGFLLIWLVGSLGPSVATSDAPSSIRDILALVTVFVFPALSLVTVGRWIKSRLSALRFQGGRRLLAAGHLLLIGLAIVPSCVLTARDYFFRWPQLEAVRFVHQTALTAIGNRLDGLPPQAEAAVAGWSVHTLDRPTLELATRREVSGIRLCDLHEEKTLVIPAGQDSRLFIPNRLPFDEDLRERLLSWGAVEKDEQGPFASYALPNRMALERGLARLEDTVTAPDGATVGLPASFDGHLAFLGYEWLHRDCDDLKLLTYWRVEDPPPVRLKVFVHLLDEAGHRVAQHDGLGSPPQGWAPGDLVMQKHTIAPSQTLTPGLYKAQVGLYNASSGSRLSVAGVERLRLSPIEVRHRRALIHTGFDRPLNR